MHFDSKREVQGFLRSEVEKGHRKNRMLEGKTRKTRKTKEDSVIISGSQQIKAIRSTSNLICIEALIPLPQWALDTKMLPLKALHGQKDLLPMGG